MRAVMETAALAATQLSEQIEASDYRLLYEYLHLGPGLALLSDERYSEDRVLDRLEVALADEDLINEISAGLVAIEALEPAQRERASQGLRALLEPGEHWTQSCDQLHRLMEGALWDAALAEGVISDHRRLRSPERPGREGRLARQAADLLDPDHGLAMDPYLRRLLKNRVFDRTSHDVRHGRSTADTRRFALESALALFGWLDRASEEPWAVPALAARINVLEGSVVADEPHGAQHSPPPVLSDLVPDSRRGTTPDSGRS